MARYLFRLILVEVIRRTVRLVSPLRAAAVLLLALAVPFTLINVLVLAAGHVTVGTIASLTVSVGGGALAVWTLNRTRRHP